MRERKKEILRSVCERKKEREIIKNDQISIECFIPFLMIF